MIHISDDFLNVWKTKRNFTYTITITFTDGTVKTLTDSQIALSNGSIEIDTGASSFPLGCAFAKTFTINLSNTQDEWSEYDFMGAKFKVTCKLPDVPSDVIDFGTFTVIEPENYGATISVKAIDEMHKADRVYVPTINFPANAEDVFTDVCLHGLNGSVLFNYITSNFPNNKYQCNKPDEKATCREVLGMLSMLAGGNIGLDKDSKVKFYLYDKTMNSKLAEILDGGRFDNVESSGAYQTGDNADGGSFDNPSDLTTLYQTGDSVDGGSFIDWNYYHDLSYALNLTTETDDVVITGIRTTIEDTVYLAGTDVYALEVENSLFKDYQAGVNAIFSVLGGLKFRPYTMEHICYPIAEIGDSCYLRDRKGRTYISFVTSIDFSLKGKTSFSCTADSPVRNSSTYSSESVKAYQKAHEEILVEKNTREKAIEDMEEQIENSSGFYETDITDEETGAITRYIHNKPKLEDSDIRWKYTSETISVSTDYGKTWNASINVDGDSIVNKLYAKTLIGTSIQNDTGTFNVNTDGTINGANLYLGGNNNIDGSMTVKNSSDVDMAQLNKDGLKIFTDTTYVQINADTTDDSDRLAKLEIGHTENSAGSSHAKILAHRDSMEIDIGSYASDGNVIKYIKYDEAYDNLRDGSLEVFSSYDGSVINMTAGQIELKNGPYTSARHWLMIPPVKFSANYTSHPWEVGSDRRLKRDIETLNKEKAKEFVYNTNPVSYSMIEDTTGRIHHGFIAQEIEEIAYDRWGVASKSPNDMYGVVYTELIADLVSVVQSQHEEIEELKARLDKLEGR